MATAKRSRPIDSAIHILSAAETKTWSGCPPHAVSRRLPVGMVRRPAVARRSSARRMSSTDHPVPLPRSTKAPAAQWSAPMRRRAVLTDHSGGGSGSERFILQNRASWLWPLPPSRDLDLALEWPSFDIQLTRVPIDDAEMAEAPAGVARRRSSASRRRRGQGQGRVAAQGGSAP